MFLEQKKIITLVASEKRKQIPVRQVLGAGLSVCALLKL
jgi:hypothetical protein